MKNNDVSIAQAFNQTDCFAHIKLYSALKVGVVIAIALVIVATVLLAIWRHQIDQNPAQPLSIVTTDHCQFVRYGHVSTVRIDHDGKPICNIKPALLAY